MNFKARFRLFNYEKLIYYTKWVHHERKSISKTITHAKHILSQTGLGKLRKFSRVNFYTEKSFMSDKFNIVDYYKTIIRFIRKMLN